MVANSWMYDVIIYTYALSLLFYFFDVIRKNRKAQQIGTGVLVFVWVLQTILIVMRMVWLRQQDLPVLSSFEFLLLFSWLLVTVSFMISRFFYIEFIVFFVNLIGIGLHLVNRAHDPTTSIVFQEWEMFHILLLFHIVLAACGFAALTVGAVFSGMYLFLHCKLKAKQWSDAVSRLPSLEKMERLSYVATFIGIPLFLTSLAAAVGVVILGNRMELLVDFKIWLTLFALVSYSFYFITRSHQLSTGFRLAVWNVGCYVSMVLNFSLNSLSTFHRWMGM